MKNTFRIRKIRKGETYDLAELFRIPAYVYELNWIGRHCRNAAQFIDAVLDHCSLKQRKNQAIKLTAEEITDNRDTKLEQYPSSQRLQDLDPWDVIRYIDWDVYDEGGKHTGKTKLRTNSRLIIGWALNKHPYSSVLKRALEYQPLAPAADPKLAFSHAVMGVFSLGATRVQRSKIQRLRARNKLLAIICNAGNILLAHDKSLDDAFWILDRTLRYTKRIQGYETREKNGSFRRLRFDLSKQRTWRNFGSSALLLRWDRNDPKDRISDRHNPALKAFQDALLAAGVMKGRATSPWIIRHPKRGPKLPMRVRLRLDGD